MFSCRVFEHKIKIIINNYLINLYKLLLINTINLKVGSLLSVIKFLQHNICLASNISWSFFFKIVTVFNYIYSNLKVNIIFTISIN